MSFEYLKARLLAVEYHNGQKYGTHDYFNYHICGVVSSIEKCLLGDEFSIVGYLHDILEDTNCSEQEILDTFGQDILDSVIAITKNYYGDETRDQYIQRCSQNEIARVVKLHDATFNMLNCAKENDFNKVNYYLKTIRDLEAFNNGGK